MFGRSAKPLSGRYLSFAEREEIALLRAQGSSMQEVARRLGRAVSTISRELRRNAATRSGGLEYRAITAQWHAERSARRPKPGKLAVNAALRTYVEERLAGTVVAPGGALVPGPMVYWKGRRHGRRKDRRWAKAWSPEQIARRLPIDFPDDDNMRISHEAIYQALFVQGRGALRRELTACLRTGRPLRIPRARARGRGNAFISPEIMISKRPPEAADRAVLGHWEGDLILGLGSSAIVTLVERTTRFTLLLHLPRMPDYGRNGRMKNGPALAGHGADAVRDAITRTIITLPQQLRRSLTWDQGAEMAQHARLKIDTGVQVFFCDPQSPWQRGTNENTNGLLRQYFPRGTDLTLHSAEQIAAVARRRTPHGARDTRPISEIRHAAQNTKVRQLTVRPANPPSATESRERIHLLIPALPFYRILNRRLRGLQEFIEPILDDCVALARCLLETRTIENLNPPAVVADEAGRLHRLRRQCHRLAIGTQNMRQKFVGIGQQFAFRPVMHHEQPSAHSFFRRMHGIASDGLLDL
jgi:IS30 family transposase